MKKEFKTYISQAIKEIELRDFEVAKEYIQNALLQRTSSPEPFNLLGILEEYNGDFLQACKYYRAAYALDPTYKAASNNLDRVTSNYYINKSHEIDFGEIDKHAEKNLLYYVEYDQSNVGHIKKAKDANKIRS